MAALKPKAGTQAEPRAPQGCELGAAGVGPPGPYLQQDLVRPPRPRRCPAHCQQCRGNLLPPQVRLVGRGSAAPLGTHHQHTAWCSGLPSTLQSRMLPSGRHSDAPQAPRCGSPRPGSFLWGYDTGPLLGAHLMVAPEESHPSPPFLQCRPASPTPTALQRAVPTFLSQLLQSLLGATVVQSMGSASEAPGPLTSKLSAGPPSPGGLLLASQLHPHPLPPPPCPWHLLPSGLEAGPTEQHPWDKALWAKGPDPSATQTALTWPPGHLQAQLLIPQNRVNPAGAGDPPEQKGVSHRPQPNQHGLTHSAGCQGAD